MSNIYINEALKEANIAYEKNEVPVGCVIVKDNKIIARAHNNKESTNDITSHAEINAIKDASKVLNNWKLDDCILYVTVEPCLMCYSAIMQSRIKKVYYGCKQDDIKKVSYKYHVKEELIELINLENEECKNIIKKFFLNMRRG